VTSTCTWSAARRSASRWSPRACRTSRSRGWWCPGRTSPARSCGSLTKENVPGEFPYTAGVFPLKRQGEDPKRMFAGEGGPAKTNRRFHFLCQGEVAHRLSTAFDSVTLYGEDPARAARHLGQGRRVRRERAPPRRHEDRLYGGFDLCAPTTSVSMTINGPAPILLAMFLNTAIDQQLDVFSAREGRAPTEPEEAASAPARSRRSAAPCRPTSSRRTRRRTPASSRPFALRMMGDIQQYFIDHEVRNFYSVDQRVPHRRGRREPDQPARVHAGQRLHVRRVLPGARDGRSTTSRPT
jgi:methylmalonyl-CoA mutase N-terminal domain/subunit